MGVGVRFLAALLVLGAVPTASRAQVAPADVVGTYSLSNLRSSKCEGSPLSGQKLVVLSADDTSLKFLSELGPQTASYDPDAGRFAFSRSEQGITLAMEGTFVREPREMAVHLRIDLKGLLACSSTMDGSKPMDLIVVPTGTASDREDAAAIASGLQQTPPPAAADDETDLDWLPDPLLAIIFIVLLICTAGMTLRNHKRRLRDECRSVGNSIRDLTRSIPELLSDQKRLDDLRDAQRYFQNLRTKIADNPDLAGHVDTRDPHFWILEGRADFSKADWLPTELQRLGVKIHAIEDSLKKAQADLAEKKHRFAKLNCEAILGEERSEQILAEQAEIERIHREYEKQEIERQFEIYHHLNPPPGPPPMVDKPST